MKPGQRRLAAEAGLVFVMAAVLGNWLFGPGQILYDTDSYFHLAIGRAYAEEGLIDELPQLRYSVLRDGFGDKEFGFHLLLAPWTALSAEHGGRWALTFFNALLATLVGLVARWAIGPWGWLVPFWLPFASTELAWRLVRLRPELLALLLFMLGLWAAARKNYRWLAVVALVFTLSYTAFHAFVGLFGLLFLLYGWQRRSWEWQLVLYPGLGSGLAWLLHPHFPHNIRVWAVQNVSFFFNKAELDVGTEILPGSTASLLTTQLGWWIGLLCLWLAARRAGSPSDPRDRMADRTLLAFGLAAAVFTGLYLLMSRFVLYAVPLTTLAVLIGIRARGRRLGPWIRLPGERRLPTWLALTACLAISLPEAATHLRGFRWLTDAGPGGELFEQRQALGQAIEPGANILAPWGHTAVLLYWAPQGRYLNALEPSFMAVPEPAAYEAMGRIWSGREPDIPLSAAAQLDSNYLAYSAPDMEPLLAERLASDPRIAAREFGGNSLFEFRPAPGAFELDWRLVPTDMPQPLDSAHEIDGWPRYPRLAEPSLAALEGLVDARRVGGAEGCVSFVRDLEIASRQLLTYELASLGPSGLWLDGQRLTALPRGVEAVLGHGPRVELRLDAGRHRLQVSSCPAEDGENGFYLVRRDSGATDSVSVSPG